MRQKVKSCQTDFHRLCTRREPAILAYAFLTRRPRLNKYYQPKRTTTFSQVTYFDRVAWWCSELVRSLHGQKCCVRLETLQFQVHVLFNIFSFSAFHFADVIHPHPAVCPCACFAISRRTQNSCSANIRARVFGPLSPMEYKMLFYRRVWCVFVYRTPAMEKSFPPFLRSTEMALKSQNENSQNCKCDPT